VKELGAMLFEFAKEFGGMEDEGQKITPLMMLMQRIGQ
jgi:hypothetical protein